MTGRHFLLKRVTNSTKSNLHGTFVEIHSQGIHTDFNSSGIGRGTVGTINGVLHNVFWIEIRILWLLVALEEVVGIPRIVTSLYDVIE